MNISFRADNRIPYTLANQSRVIISAMQEVNPNIQKLNKAVKCSGAKRALTALKELTGIETVFQDGGFSLRLGDKIIKIFAPEPRILKVREQNPDKRKQFRYVELKDSAVEVARGFHSRSESIEEFLTSVFEKLDFPILQLRRFFKRSEIEEVLNQISPKAVLNEKTAQTTDDIRSLYSEIRERITSVSSVATRSKIKNGYKNAKPSNQAATQLEFANLGVDKKNYSVNIIATSASDKYLVVKIFDEGEKPQVIIVDSMHRVFKEKPLGKVYNLGEKSVFYNQQELDSPLFAPKLEVLKREMELYNEYLKQKIEELNAYNAYRSTGEVGYLDKKTLGLIKTVKSLFDACKAKMLKIKDAPRKNAFKQKYQIDTIMSSPSLIFRNVNEEGETLHLSFPKIGGDECMKIIIEKRNGNIGRGLFIQGDKSVKFNPSSIGRSKRTDTGFNYYSQEEIEASGLVEYLTIIKKRLSLIPINGVAKK